MVEYGDSRLPDRFWDKAHVVADASTSPGPCWIWSGAVTGGDLSTGGGYSTFTHQRRTMLGHRVSYSVLVSEIPSGLKMDHLCRNRSCVNPAHLEPVTSRVNILRGEGMGARYAKRTHCPKGHAFSGENVRIQKDGHRRCMACYRKYLRDWRRKKAAK